MFQSSKVIQHTAELRRILALPSREVDGAALVQPLTEALKKPGGTETFRPLQAQALYDMGTQGGLFGPLRVGAGKTLVTLLAPVLLESKRPVLLLPASLIGKTRDDQARLTKHWKIPTSIRMISYEMMGRVQGAQLLSFYQPDLIIGDEAHKLSNWRAGVTRRVVRYFREKPETKAVFVSGTIMKKSLRDFAHLLRFALKDGAPIPKSSEETELWADALDMNVHPFQRTDPGALRVFLPPGNYLGPDEELGAIRRGFQKRLLNTPGVVGSSGDQVACSIYIEGHTYPVQSVTEQHFKTLRETWCTPDGWAFSEAIELWRHARELALGLCYRWSPRPPSDWLEARRNWAGFVRETLSHSRTLDTELQVALAYPDQEELTAWKKIKGTFTPNSVPDWYDQSAVEWCAKWMEKGPGIVWTEHRFVADMIAKVTGRPYFGQNGVDKNGLPIEKASGAIIASVAANGTGRNLQKWHRNLITSCPMSSSTVEQLFGRTHRDGQEADAVTFDIMLGCAENVSAIHRARENAQVQRDLLGHEQKLLSCDLVMPVTPIHGARWQVSKQK